MFTLIIIRMYQLQFCIFIIAKKNISNLAGVTLVAFSICLTSVAVRQTKLMTYKAVKDCKICLANTLNTPSIFIEM